MCSSGITESQHDDKHGIINDIVLMLYIYLPNTLGNRGNYSHPLLPHLVLFWTCLPNQKKKKEEKTQLILCQSRVPAVFDLGQGCA